MKSSWLHKDNQILFTGEVNPAVVKGVRRVVTRSIHLSILFIVEGNVYWNVVRPLPQYLHAWLEEIYGGLYRKRRILR